MRNILEIGYPFLFTMCKLSHGIAGIGSDLFTLIIRKFKAVIWWKLSYKCILTTFLNRTKKVRNFFQINWNYEDNGSV